jgi:hypothetical protein
VGGGFTDDFNAPDHGILFCVSARKSASAVSFTYDAIRRDASRISRSRPSWSASINADCGGENMLAREAIW